MEALRSGTPPGKDAALIALVRAQTGSGTIEDRNLLEHVSLCKMPRPCTAHALCDVSKEQLAHFRRCKERTCDPCALARLIAAKDRQRPVAEWQLKLVTARKNLHKATANTKEASKVLSNARSSNDGDAVGQAKSQLQQYQKA